VELSNGGEGRDSQGGLSSFIGGLKLVSSECGLYMVHMIRGHMKRDLGSDWKI
jgi:hypothetical protein